jgi:hypothetical protein
VFDKKTRTIRAMHDRNKVISTQLGGTFDHGREWAAVVMNYDTKRASFQRTRFFGGPAMNIRNDGEKCLEVQGRSNTHHRHVVWSASGCMKGWWQSWSIDPIPYGKPNFPLADGVKFQLKSKMPESRALYLAEYIGGNQFRLRIRDNHPEDMNQWWTFDARTRTIRAWTKRDYSIANQNGAEYKVNHAAVISKFDNKKNQRSKWHAGETNNIQSYGHTCLDVVSRQDRHTQHLTWSNCQKWTSQGWKIDQTVIKYEQYPKSDGEKFQIRSVMKENRALFWAEHIGSW